MKDVDVAQENVERAARTMARCQHVEIERPQFADEDFPFLPLDSGKCIDCGRWMRLDGREI